MNLFSHLCALFDGRGDVVEADGALEEGEEGVGVHGAELEAGLLHEHGVHPGALLLLPETDISHSQDPRR